MQNHNPHIAMNAGIILLLLLVLVLLNGCSSIGIKEQNRGQEEASFPVYVVNHGMHTGVIVARDHAVLDLPIITDAFVHSRYIEIGWGDEDYYQSKVKTSGLSLQAVLYPTNSVLHVAGVPIDPEKHYPEIEVAKILVTGAGLKSMLTHISKTFKRDTRGAPLTTGKGLHVHGLFYHAKGKFHVCNTCNTWTAETLKKAGIHVSSFLTITADDIMDQIRHSRTNSPRLTSSPQ